MELDHIIPKRLGGKDETSNLQVLHRHCHDQKTAHDGSNGAKESPGISDNDLDAEEPDAVKVARPVREWR
jgi:RNA-directed DNA polymerase